METPNRHIRSSNSQILKSSNVRLSPSASSCQIVERPVERLEDDLDLVLGEECLLGGQQFGVDEGERCALDGAAAGERRGGSVGVGGDEVGRPPREDRADVELVRVAI